MGWMQQKPVWAAGVVVGVAFAVAWFGSTFLTMPELGVGPRALVSLVAGAFFGVVMGSWVGRVRRAHGDVARRPAFGRAVRTGTLPPDADTAEWRQALLARQRLHRPLRWTAPVLYVPATALAVWLAVTGQPVFWFGAALFVAALVATVVTTPRVLRNTATLLAELDRREVAQHPAR